MNCRHGGDAFVNCPDCVTQRRVIHRARPSWRRGCSRPRRSAWRSRRWRSAADHDLDVAAHAGFLSALMVFFMLGMVVVHGTDMAMALGLCSTTALTNFSGETSV